MDFQAHGESPGNKITFGHLESLDVEAALRFLKERFPGERIGVIGTSMGAAAMVLAEHRPPVQAIILESMYPTIDQATQDRLRLSLGRGIAAYLFHSSPFSSACAQISAPARCLDHSIQHLEMLTRVGQELSISRMIRGLHGDNLCSDLRKLLL
jgi:pimeloyl-ACP methyl ester carboxylesterase